MSYLSSSVLSFPAKAATGFTDTKTSGNSGVLAFLGLLTLWQRKMFLQVTAYTAQGSSEASRKGMEKVSEYHEPNPAR